MVAFFSVSLTSFSAVLAKIWMMPRRSLFSPLLRAGALRGPLEASLEVSSEALVEATAEALASGLG